MSPEYNQIVERIRTNPVLRYEVNYVLKIKRAVDTFIGFVIGILVTLSILGWLKCF